MSIRTIMSFAIKMSKLKYLDRNLLSRSSLTRSTSPSQLPNIPHRPIDSFTISLRKHLNQSEVNPEHNQVHSIRYYLDNQLAACPTSLPEQIRKNNNNKKRKNEHIQSGREKGWREGTSRMKEKTFDQLYTERVSENLKHYGNGMMRSRHQNSLGVASKEVDLLRLHYRLKKERELSIIQREERRAELKFKRLLSQYETQLTLPSVAKVGIKFSISPKQDHQI